MKTQFHILGLNVNAGLRLWLEQPLERLERYIAVTSAAVVLEHRRDEAPAFRAFVSLAVPGPDIHAEARDHTLQAAWLKVTTNLRKQIEQRKSRQGARIKKNGRVRAPVGRRAKSMAVVCG
jgi:ribosomal subunit interface protein